ncbi:MAG: FAD-dependent oxidoreductase, partial [Pirellulales bacterium]|nr:FAD-dependent oxidoreductase [Pirellulales bacterium]
MSTDFVDRHEYDIVVAGATPAGIAAAIAAARLGSRVAIVECQRHVGGMMTSGLGKSDIETRDAVGGLFAEFASRVLEFYTLQYGSDSEQVAKCNDGYYYEPSVAERVFDEMLAEQPNIVLYLEHELSGVLTERNESRCVQVVDRSNRRARSLHGATLIDATYEGDMLALAGCEFRQGRESRSDFEEPHAGVIYLDHETHELLDGSTGEADDRLPAYTYRLCLTDDPANAAVLREPPPGYNRADYLAYLDDLVAGRLAGPRNPPPGRGFYTPHFNTLARVFSFAELPNHKFDVNINPRPLGFPFGEENVGYVEADWTGREAIAARHRALTLGLLYFIQNDPAVPAAHRELAS